MDYIAQKQGASPLSISILMRAGPTFLKALSKPGSNCLKIPRTPAGMLRTRQTPEELSTLENDVRGLKEGSKVDNCISNDLE